MKNWDKVEADKNVLMNKHFTKGRQGNKVDFIVIHHNGGTLTTQGCWDVWQKREASAHYQVEADGTIGQLVWDSDTAWHAGNWSANLRSIGIEHANNSRSPWTVSDATLEEGAHLVASLCKRFNLGEPRWGENVFPHSHFRSTDCPGELQASQQARYMERAQYWWRIMTGEQANPAPAPAPAPQVEGDDESLARAVIRGDYGNGQARRDALGSRYEEVQARVNQILEGDSAVYDVEAMALAVIRGDYGNGAERRRRLGVHYDEVQARVNQILGA